MQFGELEIDRLSKNFKEVRLDGTHTKFNINVSNGDAYQVDAMGEHAGIRYPSGVNVRYEKDKSNTHEVRGYVGSEGADALIHVRMTHGGLEIDD